MKKDFEGRKHLRQAAETARALRAESRRFLGFEGSMTAIQVQMLSDFNASATILHSGDKGTARENVLRDFLKGPYLPKRYGVAEGTGAVVATNGAMSGQIDITIYDALDAPRLLDVGGIQYFPVESVFGVVQVKSNLSSTAEIVDGLDNIASFKSLRCRGHAEPLGFGILFAYTASLRWPTIIETIAQWERANPSVHWPNLVCVLDQGHILNLAGRRTTVHNATLQAIKEPSLYPILSDGAELVTFYLLLLDILSAISLPRIPHWSYANLPMWIENHSVRFTFGAFSQVGNCPEHGSYLKDLAPGAANKIVAGCAGQSKVNEWSLFMDSDAPTPGEPNVYAFDPEGHGRAAFQMIETLIGADGQARVVDGGLGFEAIEIDEQVYYVPYYYDTKLALVKRCSKCDQSQPLPQMTLEDWQTYLRERAERRRQRVAVRNESSESDETSDK
jgi:hypothetical protein